VHGHANEDRGETAANCRTTFVTPIGRNPGPAAVSRVISECDEGSVFRPEYETSRPLAYYSRDSLWQRM
jgi:hypothetical protein